MEFRTMKNTNRSVKIVFILIFFLVFFRFFNPQKAQAQNAIDLAITPPTAYLKIKPGSTASHTLTIENSGDTPLTVTPQIRDFFPDGTTGIPVLQKESSFPYFDAASQNLQPLTIEARAKAKLTLAIVVPQSAENREYPMTILFSTSRVGQQAEETQARVAASIGSNVIVLVSDDSSPPVSLSVKSVQVAKVVDTFSPIKFKPIVENKGYAAAVASGSATIRSMLGTVVYEHEIEPVVVLGNSEREVFPKNEQHEQLPFVYAPLFSLGLYTVDVTLLTTTSDGATSVSKSVNSLALPLFVLGGLLVVIISYVLVKKYKKIQFT